MAKRGTLESEMENASDFREKPDSAEEKKSGKTFAFSFLSLFLIFESINIRVMLSRRENGDTL